MHAAIRAPLRPTEDPERVRDAVVAFFPDADVHIGEDEVAATASDPGALRQRIWELRIIDTFRSALLGGADGATVTVCVNKQAASQRRLSLPASPHPLGELEIRLTVEEGDPWPDADALIWWLCPETKDGEIVGDA